jgi:hypothetical protein
LSLKVCRFGSQLRRTLAELQVNPNGFDFKVGK